jgi:hypothetical protein
LVWSIKFFFSNKSNIYKQYSEFFEYDDQVKPEDKDGVDDTPKMDKKEATLRFYFSLTYQLATEEITKFGQIEELPLYLCLSTSAYKKEQYLKQKEEIDKMKKKK